MPLPDFVLNYKEGSISMKRVSLFILYVDPINYSPEK